MPYTIVAFIWRKPGITPSDFKSHYEENHIPLLISLFGPTFPMTHSRFYLPRTSATSNTDNVVPNTSNEYFIPAAVFAGPREQFDYDVYCELVFENEKGFQAFLARKQEEDAAQKIDEDEKKFIDQSKLSVARFDEPVVTTKEA